MFAPLRSVNSERVADFAAAAPTGVDASASRATLSRMRTIFVAAFLSFLVAPAAARAADKVLIAPVQAGAIVETELAVELEEAVRAGVLRQAPGLELLVMSHATLVRSLADLKAAGRDQVLGLPCTALECDAGLGRALGTELVVSTRLTKLDGKYLALMKLVQTKTDAVIASTSAETDTFGALLAEASKQAERLVGDGRAAAPKARVIEERTLRTGHLTINRAGELLAGGYNCDLSTTQLRCQSAGLFSSGQSLVIPFKDVTSVFPESGGRVVLETNYATFKIGMINMKEADRRASALEKELERQRVANELAQWRTDIDAAWRAFKGG